MSAPATPETPEAREARELVERALRLPPAVREQIALELFDSLDGPPDDPEEVKKSWRDEIARRLREVEEGKVQLVDGARVVEEMRRRLREKYGV